MVFLWGRHNIKLMGWERKHDMNYSLRFADAHGHLIPPWFTRDKLKGVVTRAREHNVYYLNSCSSDPETYEYVLETSREFPEIFPSIGLQPTIVSKEKFKEFTSFVEQNLKEIPALGEVGLDHYWVKEPGKRQRQEDFFKQIIEFANNVKKPLVIHSRKADLEAVQVLLKYADVPLYLHSFEGNLQTINLALEGDFLIGVTTSIGSRKNRKKVAQRTPLENMLLETDSPFLPFNPEIKTNEPLWIPKAAEVVSQIHGVTLSEVADKTFTNTKRFYNLK